MACCCRCCGAFRPRYKRLVDNIFPLDPGDGLVRSNMEKLTFYALSSPEKLDRIGQYLEQKVGRDVYRLTQNVRFRTPMRRRLGNVHIAMEALDQLLQACHAQTLNLFVESFLKMVQKLLECQEVELQELATNSFVKFANIEEDTASYHRRYDFFVSKFSSMCHDNDADPGIKKRIRLAGLRGLQGVVRKTVSDDLQVNIWDPSHMDKIVPSLLYNMHASKEEADKSTRDIRSALSPALVETPSDLAETCLRDLVCRAAYGNLKFVLRPVLRHLDLHELWVPNQFAVKCFKIIMYSVQAQYSFVAVEMVKSHLDEHSKDGPLIKTSIVNVLNQIVGIAAGGSVGPSVLEVFNTMLRHLRQSIATKPTKPEYVQEEKAFQEAVINTIAEFASNLPDYQKVDIMMFIITTVPQTKDDPDDESSGDVLLQHMLLRSILKISTNYSSTNMVTTFPSSFMTPLLRLSLMSNAEIRILVQQIFHCLLDRHNNRTKLAVPRIPKDISELALVMEQSTKQDTMFMKKNGYQLYAHLYECLQYPNNAGDNIAAVYTTLSLICIELGNEEILVELIRLTLAIQESGCSSDCISISQRCMIHGVVATYLNLISQLTAIPSFCQHVSDIIGKYGRTYGKLLFYTF